MIPKVTTTQLPTESKCPNFITNIDFQDAYSVALSNSNISIENIYLNIFAHSPKWVDGLLQLRNNIVGLFGLDTYKNSPEISTNNLKIGSKTGIFRIYAISDNEIIAGEDDKHLDFRVSILKQNEKVIISTLVHYNNNFGKAYMSLIMPFHKIVVKAMLKNAMKNNRL